jgi:hypothetical protein
MNRTRSTLVLALALAAAACGALAAGESYTLAYKFAKGADRRGRVKANMTARLEVSSGGKTAKKTMATVIADVVTGGAVAEVAPDGTATIARRIEKMTLKLKFSDEETVAVVSSNQAKVTVNGSGRPIDGGRTFSVENLPLFGRAVRFSLRPTGEITDGEEDLEQAWQGILKRLGICKNSSDYTGLLAVSEDMLLPEKPVMVGDTWERRQEITGQEKTPTEVITEYTLDNVEKVKGDRIARISYRTSPDLSGVDPKAWNLPDVPGVELKQGKRRAAGVILFNIDEGALVRDESDLALEFLYEGVVEGQHSEAKLLFEAHTRVD